MSFEVKTTDSVQIKSEFTAYEIMWKCEKGHTNFQTVLGKGNSTDICLKCGKHYEFEVK